MRVPTDMAGTAWASVAPNLAWPNREMPNKAALWAKTTADIASAENKASVRNHFLIINSAFLVTAFRVPLAPLLESLLYLGTVLVALDQKPLHHDGRAVIDQEHRVPILK